MPEFEAKKGDFAKFGKTGGLNPPATLALLPMRKVLSLSF